MTSNSLQQNFILFLEKTKETKEDARNPKPPNGRLGCVKCRFSTKDSALFERHVAQHEEVTFSCTKCNHVSYSRVESQRHLVEHKGSFPYKCNWCSYGAVRRDYMVKHIQRIHGKCATGNILTDCVQQVEEMYLTTPRTLCGPSHDVQVVSHSAGSVSSLLSSASQTRPIAPYHVTSTAYTLPVKSQPYIVPNTTQTVCKIAQGTVNPTVNPANVTVKDASPMVIQGFVNPPNVTVKEVGPTVGKATEYKKMAEKSFLDKTAVTSALPRVHVGVSGERAVQQKPPLQSQVVGTTEKLEIPSKILPKIQVGIPVSNNNHLKTLLGNQREAPVAQKSVFSGAVQNIPVENVAQRSVPSSASPILPGERFRPGVPSIKRGVQTQGKTTQPRTRPNILVKTPTKSLESSPKSGVGLLAPLNQPVQGNRPLITSSPKERNPPRSSVQVELLAPLNQPIQHNKPLTVSCPEEITIPAGCLVELVEVKNVNGTRELELRLVPQQFTGPQQGDLKSTTESATTSRLSFKCRVATDDNQPINTNQEINSPKSNAVGEHLVQQTQLKKHSVDDKLNVKNETVVKEKVLCSRMNGTQAPGSSSKWVSRSLCSNPSDSRKFIQQLCGGQKAAATEPVKPLPQMNSPIKTVCPRSSQKNIVAEGLKCELRADQPSASKSKDDELSYQGLPIISSVFSLCPIPQDIQSLVQPREQAAKISLVSQSKESIKSTNNPIVCTPTLKIEDETDSVQKIDPFPEQKDVILKEPQAHEEAVKENLVATVENAFANEDGAETTPEPCSSSTDALQTDPSNSVNCSSRSPSDHSTQPENLDAATLAESEKSLLAQADSSHASSMNPKVTLIRMPSLELFSHSESASDVQEKRDTEESITARPVVCTSNQQNLQERTIKLVLKRKWSETATSQDQRIGLVYVDLPRSNKKAKKCKKRAKKRKSSKVQHVLGNDATEKMSLTPLKDDQLVKRPGPNQPVVVLNHPNPLGRIEGQSLNSPYCQNSSPDPCNQDGTTLPKHVKTCPAFKMTLKKVQGQEYQVTQLLLQGVSENTAL